MSSVTPAAIRKADPTNARVAQYLQLLPDAFSTTAESTAMPLLKTAMAMILPANVAFDSPDTLKADAAISFVALTQAEHALDFYVD